MNIICIDCMPTDSMKSSIFSLFYTFLTKLSFDGWIKNDLRRGGEEAQRRRSPKEETAMSIRTMPDSRLILSIYYTKNLSSLNANRHNIQVILLTRCDPSSSNG